LLLEREIPGPEAPHGHDRSRSSGERARRWPWGSAVFGLLIAFQGCLAGAGNQALGPCAPGDPFGKPGAAAGLLDTNVIVRFLRRCLKDRVGNARGVMANSRALPVPLILLPAAPGLIGGSWQSKDRPRALRWQTARRAGAGRFRRGGPCAGRRAKKPATRRPRRWARPQGGTTSAGPDRDGGRRGRGKRAGRPLTMTRGACSSPRGRHAGHPW